MSFTPQQNWEAYHASINSDAVAFANSLTPEEKFARYCDLYNLVISLRDGKAEHQRTLSDKDEKIKLRTRLIKTYQRIQRVNP
jgi:hypothetical protein